MRSFIKMYVKTVAVILGCLFLAFVMSLIPIWFFHQYNVFWCLGSVVGEIVVIFCPILAFLTKDLGGER